MTRSFTADDFMKALADGSLREPIVKEGMVKPNEEDSTTLLLSEGTSCVLWTAVPIDMIDKVEFMKMVRCKDHQHAFVRLYIKEPPEANQTATVLAQLLRHSLIASRTVPRTSPNKIRRRRARSSDSGVCTYYVKLHCGDGSTKDWYGQGDDCASARSDAYNPPDDECHLSGISSIEDESDPCECS